jgi:hypothetical protein
MNRMTEFKLSKRIPSCLVTKDLVLNIERYLKIEMMQRIGEQLGTSARNDKLWILSYPLR